MLPYLSALDNAHVVFKGALQLSRFTLLYFYFTYFSKMYSAVKTLHLYVVCAMDACDLFDVGKFIVNYKRQN